MLSFSLDLHTTHYLRCCAEEQASNVREVKRYKNGFIMDPMCFTKDQTVSAGWAGDLPYRQDRRRRKSSFI